MPTADGRAATPRADRHLVQLCRHAGRMREVRAHLRHRGRPGHGTGFPEMHRAECTGTDGLLLIDGGACTLRATPDALLLHVEATDGPALDRIRNLLTSRLERSGRRDGLHVEWQRPPGTTPDTQDAVHVATAGPRRWRTPTAGIVLAVAFVIAVHLGLVGALLATPHWAVGAGALVVATMAVKVLVVVLLERRRRRTRSASTPGDGAEH